MSNEISPIYERAFATVFYEAKLLTLPTRFTHCLVFSTIQFQKNGRWVSRPDLRGVIRQKPRSYIKTSASHQA